MSESPQVLQPAWGSEPSSPPSAQGSQADGRCSQESTLDLTSGCAGSLLRPHISFFVSFFETPLNAAYFNWKVLSTATYTEE